MACFCYVLSLFFQLQPLYSWATKGYARALNEGGVKYINHLARDLLNPILILQPSHLSSFSHMVL